MCIPRSTLGTAGCILKHQGLFSKNAIERVRSVFIRWISIPRLETLQGNSRQRPAAGGDPPTAAPLKTSWSSLAFFVFTKSCTKLKKKNAREARSSPRIHLRSSFGWRRRGEVWLRAAAERTPMRSKSCGKRSLGYAGRLKDFVGAWLGAISKKSGESGLARSRPSPTRSWREEGESAVGWGQRGSEIGRERGNADGRGPNVSERKRGEECTLGLEERAEPRGRRKGKGVHWAGLGSVRAEIQEGGGR